MYAVSDERKRRPNFIENGILSPKNPKDESLGGLKLFKNRNLGNYLQNEVWENLFQNQRELEKREVTRGPWVTCIRWSCRDV